MKEMPRLSKQEKEEILNMIKNGDNNTLEMVKTMVSKYISIYPRELKFKKKYRREMKLKQYRWAIWDKFDFVEEEIIYNK